MSIKDDYCYDDKIMGNSDKEIVIKSSRLTGWGIWEHSNFDRNEPPKLVRPLKGMSAWTAMVCPGMLLSSGPDWVQNAIIY